MKFASFLRGINVGRAKRVAMRELRALAGELGYSKVRTLRNSGNLIFDTTPTKGKTASKRIEKELYSRLNVAAKVITLTEEELDAVIAENPLEEVATNPSRFLVAILENPEDRERLAPVMEQEWTPEIIAAGPRVVYLWCPGGVLASPLAKSMLVLLGEAVTTRNWATMLKVQKMVKQR
jgi:uncharacterized protein (DUF1697 family)